MTDTSAIIPLNTTTSLQSISALMDIVLQMRQHIMKDGTDYGTIPGTNKPTLLLPGMEKIMRALNAVPQYIERCVVRDYDKPLFHFEYECQLIEINSGLAIPGGRGIGLCTSYESAFRWRWVDEADLPADMDKSGLQRRDGRKTLSEFEFAINKAETTGQYAKPAEHWQMFKEAIASGSAKQVMKPTKKGTSLAYEITMGTYQYRVPNPDIYDQVNAISKRAQKRALGSAVKGAAAVSEFFTVDLEDFEDMSMVYSPPIITIEPEPYNPAPQQPAAAPRNNTVPFPGNTPPPATTPEPPHWSLTPDGKKQLVTLISRAKDKGYIEAKQGEKDLLKLIGANNWLAYDGIGSAGQAVKDAAEALLNQASQPKPELTATARQFKYDGKKISFPVTGGWATLFSRQEFAKLLNDANFVGRHGILTLEAQDGFIKCDPLIVTYRAKGQFFEVTGLALAEPAPQRDPNNLDDFLGTPPAPAAAPATPPAPPVSDEPDLDDIPF